MNDDLYGLQASGIAPEIAAKLIPLQRQQAVAEAMLKQSMNPIEVPRGTKISPFQGLAQMVQAYMARKGLESADTERQALTTQNAEMAKSAMSDYEAKKLGSTPIQPLTPNDDEGNAMPVTQAVKGDPRAAVAMAMSNPLLAKNPLISADLATMRQEEIPVVGPAGSVLYDRKTGKVIGQAPFKPDKPKPPMTDYQIAQVRQMIAQGKDIGLDVSGMEAELQNALAGRQAINPTAPTVGMTPPKIGLDGAPIPPAASAAAAANQPFVMSVGPDGQVVNNTPPGAKLSTNLAPASQRKIAETQAITDIKRESEKQQLVDKQEVGMRGLTPIINEARSILSGIDPATGQKYETPTSSGLGSFVDKVAGWGGFTTSGAKAADRMRVVGSALVAKVPRFEGPQSDADRKYYIEMAGQVGDDSIPIDRRLAALDTVQRIWSMFEGGKKSDFVGIGPTSNVASGKISGATTGFADPEKERRYQEWLKNKK